jgi:hypothetical protein
MRLVSWMKIGILGSNRYGDEDSGATATHAYKTHTYKGSPQVSLYKGGRIPSDSCRGSSLYGERSQGT